MAWSNKGRNGFNTYQETVDLVDTTTGYTSEIDFLKISRENNNKYISVLAEATAVTGTNVDIALYGAMESGGDKFLLKDAIIADITDTTATGGVFDLNLYPAPYYYISFTTDADESANDMTFTVFAS